MLGLLIVGRVIQGVGGGDLPARVRDHPRRVPARARRRPDRADLRDPRHRRRLGIVLAGPDRRRALLPLAVLVPLVLIVVATIATFFFVPESPIDARAVNWRRRRAAVVVARQPARGDQPGHAWGWGAPRTIGLFAAGGVAAVVLGRASSTASPEPLVDMTMMRIRGVLDGQRRGVPGRRRDVQLVPADPAVRRDAGVGRLRLRPSATAAGLFLLPGARDAARRPVRRPPANRSGPACRSSLGSLSTALAFGFLALAHDEPWEFFVGLPLLGIGIGLAFASLANLIVAPCAPTRPASRPA